MAMLSMSALIISMLFSSELLPSQPVGPKVPAKQVFQYVPHSSKLVIHLDVKSLMNHLSKSLKKAQRSQILQQNQALRMAFMQYSFFYAKILKKAEKNLNIKANQIRFVTVALDFKKRLIKPSALIIFRGKFTPTHWDSFIQKQGGKYDKQNQNGFKKYLARSVRYPSLAWTRSGQLLVGTRDTIQALGKTPEQNPANSLKARMMEQYDPSHVLAVRGKMHPMFYGLFGALPSFFKPLLTELDQFFMAIKGNGSVLQVSTTTPLTRQRYHFLMEGLGQLTKSAVHLQKAIVEFADGLLTMDKNNKIFRKPIMQLLIRDKKLISQQIRRLLKANSTQYKVSSQDLSVTMKMNGSGGPLLALGAAVAIGGANYLRFSTPKRRGRAQTTGPRTVKRSDRVKKAQTGSPTRAQKAPPIRTQRAAKKAIKKAIKKATTRPSR